MDRNHQFTGIEFYEIRVRGHLDARWSAWFDGLAVTRDESGETSLSGPVRDQAALYGLLAKVRDLGLPLISVNPIWHKDARCPVPSVPSS